MLPILYDGTSYTDNTFGLGVLSDAISTEVEEERNGIYELTMRYPISGQHYSNIALRRIIKAKPNFTDDPQMFRIYRITKPISGVVTIYARHISSDLSDKLVPVGTNGSSCAAACAALSAIASPFTITTDKSVTGTWRATEPASIRAWFGGRSGSLLDVYGTGEWYYNGTTCQLLLHRGSNRGVVIRYGKNLTELTAESDCTNMASSVLPYYMDTDGNVITGTAVSTGMIAFTREIAVDFSSDFQETPTAAQLTERCQAYVNANDFTAPKGNITLDFVQIGKLKDRVDLCDTVTIEYEALGVSASVQCIRTVWDVLAERYIETEFGDPKESATETIIAAAKAASEAVQVSTTRAAINSATSQITGNDGGYIVWHDSNQDGQPDELLVMNTPDIETATKVWRFNQNGLGFSSTGYAGPYALAMTADGAIVADMITVGTLSASLIKAGILKSLNYDSSGGTAGFSMNLETGEIFAPALVISAKNYTDTEVANALVTAKSYTDTQISVIPGQISSAISEIQIGGTNLLWFTADVPISGTSHNWRASGGTVSISPETSLPVQGVNRALRVTNSGTSASRVGFAQDKMSGFISQEVYSQGCWIRASVAGLRISLQPLWDAIGQQQATGSGYVGTTTTSWQYVKIEGLVNGAEQQDYYSAGYVYVDNVPANGWFEVCANKVEQGNKATAWTPAPEDHDTYTDNAVRSQAQATSSQITQLSDRITSTVSTVNTIQNNMLDSSDVQALIDAGNFATSSSVTQTSNNLQVLITQAQNTANSANSAAQTLTTGVTVDSNGVTVGKSTSAVKGVFSNNSLEFQSGGKAIAWLSANSEEGLGVDTIQIGDHNTANQRWIVFTTSNGSHLSFTRHQ